MNIRQIKIIFGAAIAVYMTLVCFNNLTDYDSNFQFVKMVSGMTDIFSKERTGWRAVTSETGHQLLYVFIIAWEIMVAILTIGGSIKMIRKLKAGQAEFNQAKKMLSLGISLGVLLWFGIFITIGGEWFLMWQSKNWNGQNTAFLLSITFLLFLIFLNQRDE